MHRAALRASRGLTRLAMASVLAAVLTGCSEPRLARLKIPANVESESAAIARELASICPLADPGDPAAFSSCRTAMFRGSETRSRLADIVLWGRQRDPKMVLKETPLTQLAPDVLTGMYLPLFMFSGAHTVRFVESEGMYEIRLQAAFRNRLAPGEFPYPFWHDSTKWAMYQNAGTVILWYDPSTERVRVAQFTIFGTNDSVAKSAAPVPPYPFDGRWLWTDAEGKTQPQVTVFDGLFHADNPYLHQLDRAYKSLALRLREGQCDECHVPSNPGKSKRLVLLQTPAHAGAEIKRVIEAVRADKMPRDDTGIAQPLPAGIKAALLRESEDFDTLYDAAKRWEASAAEIVDALRQ